MTYRLIITKRAEKLVDKLAYYLLNNIKNKQAASHFIDSMQGIYKRLKENPYQFPVCEDEYLAYKEYRKAILIDMNYVVIYKVIETKVYILGVFHELEQYENKL